MRKADLKKLAILGITGALLIGTQSVRADIEEFDIESVLVAGNTNTNVITAPSSNRNSNTAAPSMNEEELVKQLNPQAKKMFESLTPEGKTLALKLANQTCSAKNECKGMNSCKSEKNECAGKGGCRGTSVSNFKDKNLAVKVAADKMADKRKRLTNS